MIRKSVLWIGKACIAGVIAVGLLSLFALGYNYTGVHSTNPTGATDFVFQPYQLWTSLNEGFAWTCLDEDSFHNPVGAKDQDIDNLLMGSSQMFAVYVSAGQSTGERLNAMLPNMHTYNIGMAEHFFHTCVGNIANAVAQYHPAKYVILETSSVTLSIEDMQKILGGGYAELPSQDSGLFYVLQRYVPTAKIIYRQLMSWMPSASTTLVRDSDPMPERFHRVMNAYFAKAVEPVAASGAKLIIFYHPSTEIDAEGRLIFSTDPDELAAFRKGCEDNGILFVDMTADFQALYDQEHKLPYGFINTQVGKGHLNADGHDVISTRLMSVILHEEKKKKDLY